MKKLILASRSPRRCQLLKQFGIPFEIIPADVDETPLRNESADAMTLRLAELKANTILQQLITQHTYRVLGSDTAVVSAGVIMDKPTDRQQAIEMLQQLSGKTHQVLSAIAVVDEHQCRSLLSESSVTFKQLSMNNILQYCDTDDPYDKAGAYGIQGAAGKFVSHIKGSYSGIMGLPLWHTHQLLLG